MQELPLIGRGLHICSPLLSCLTYPDRKAFRIGYPEEHVQTRGDDLPSAERWAVDAGPYMLSLGREQNGVSLAVPGYYPEEYKATWIIKEGQGLPGLGYTF